MKKSWDPADFDFLTLLFVFWAFVFSRAFRQRCLKEFSRSGLLRRVVMLGDAILSVFFGLVIPLALVLWAVG